eukprot:TRINITY_DN8745_c0_g1_i2.p1 TRINITY_DN8745_c0_g1~~TRINITY_DN8745_c0_g1_i2.p1  ORF type:complete len:406 (-),score=125.71 TRINITY_DN8745_c0_g1_i2:48-1265(-)
MATLWDQRSRLKADELQALTSALATLSALKTPDSGAPALLQISTSPAKAVATTNASIARWQPQGAARIPPALGLVRQKDNSENQALTPIARVAAMLKTRGMVLHSAELLKVAREASADPLAKVKTLIQELVERLLKEAQDEANHKGWCDHEAGLAEQARDEKAATILELNSKLALSEARRERLNATAQAIDKEIAELNSRLNESSVLREQESKDNVKAMQDARDAKAAVDTAMTTLKQFYARAANEAKGAESFAQLYGRAPDMPDAGFDGAYGGTQGAARGVLAMLEVLAADFERAAQQADDAEKASKADFEELQKTNSAALAAKEETSKATQDSIMDANAEDSENRAALSLNQQGLDKALTELDALHKSCFDTGMSDEERKVKREEEIDALQQALEILDAHGSH